MDQLLFMNNVSIERWQEIENERINTTMDTNFQKWMKELNVSQSYVNPEGMLKAHDMMIHYDYSKYRFNI